MTASLFDPISLAGLTLRNRIIKTATFEGMCPGGMPSEQLIEHHRRLAQGGVGMTTVAYCSVDANARTFADQMYLHPELVPRLRQLTDAVHQEGAAISAQLAHCGWFTKNRAVGFRGPRGPSYSFNAYGSLSGLPLGWPMSQADIQQTIEQYRRAAGLAVEAGFDALEIHMGHGYLLSQFLCPAINRRRDEYGGSLENRMRLPREIIAAVRAEVGDQIPLLAKMNVNDGIRGGNRAEDAAHIAQHLEQAGIDSIVLSGGITSRTPLFLLRGGQPIKYMIKVDKNFAQRMALRIFGPAIIRPYTFKPLFFLEESLKVRQAVDIPVVYLGGTRHWQELQTLEESGFDMVAVGRALLADPDWAHHVADQKEQYQTPCDACNRCVTAMDTDAGVRCVRYEDNYLGLGND